MNRELQHRFRSLPVARIEDQLELTTGTMHDYDAIAMHHYRQQPCVTAARILVLRRPSVSAASRYLGRGQSWGVVAVLVETNAVLTCRMRDWVLGGRYGAIRSLAARAAVLNREMRCISRVIVRPQWRGLGLAVRLIREALGRPQTVFTEAMAAMGHVHPMFERAGMTAHVRPPHDYDARLIDALGSAGIGVMHLAMLDRARAMIDAQPDSKRTWLYRELQRWYRRSNAGKRDESVPVGVVLAAAQTRLVCEPVYYLKDNRM